MSSLILTPEHPDFYPLLHSKLPPGSTAQCYAPDADSGILKPLDEVQEIDYCLGGELDELDQVWEEDQWLTLI